MPSIFLRHLCHSCIPRQKGLYAGFSTGYPSYCANLYGKVAPKLKDYGEYCIIIADKREFLVGFVGIGVLVKGERIYHILHCEFMGRGEEELQRVRVGGQALASQEFHYRTLPQVVARVVVGGRVAVCPLE